jgi:hypothetical protein
MALSPPAPPYHQLVYKRVTRAPMRAFGLLLGFWPWSLLALARENG